MTTSAEEVQRAGRQQRLGSGENRRQHEMWERDALAELRSGSVSRALAAYEGSGRVTAAPDAETVRETMVNSWWRSRQRGEQAMMYALRRSDVEDLNRRGRALMQAAGTLGSERLVVGSREFAIGDEVLCLRNDRRLGVRNGTVGVVAGVSKVAGEVTLADGTRLPFTYMAAGHLTYAYASTVHKAQGATTDRAFLLGSDQLYREAGYVGLSRGRVSNELFVVSGDTERLETVVKGLQTSRAQSLARTQLAPELKEDVAALLADPPPWARAALGEPPHSGPGPLQVGRASSPRRFLSGACRHHRPG